MRFWLSRARRLRLFQSLGVVSLCLGTNAPVQAEPNVWDRVRDPRAARAHELFVQADSARVPADAGFESVALRRKLNERSALMIHMAGGEELGDPQLLYLLGDCLVHASGNHQEAGRHVLLRALRQAPHSPMAAEAWFNVAIASSLLRDHEQEHAAYVQALEVEWDREARARIYLNRGESNMARGNLDAAIADYRASLQETRSAVTRALSSWGLAVALDRSLDFPAAIPHAIAASRARFGPNGRQAALDLDDVFFTPPYEVHYYRALALLALAVQLEGQRNYVGALQNAKLLWLTYLQATPADGRWVARAEQHLRWVNTELQTLDDDD